MFGTGINERINQHYAQFLESTLITEGMLFPDIYRHFLDYRELLGAEPESVRSLQRKRLEEQLAHAVTQVPAYRELEPGAPLSEWPLMTKPDIRDRLVEYCDDAIQAKRCRAAYTSGTTGVPVKVIHDIDHIAHKYALALRRNHAAGLPLRRRILIPMCDGALPWIEYASPAHGNSIIAQFGSTDQGDELARLLDKASAFEPDIVYGHPSSCVAFVRALSATSAAIRPRCVLTCGENLSQPARDELESTLHAPVRDGYGMCEFGTIAVQCERGNYHIESERLVVEIVDDKGRTAAPGEPGEVVVTELVNRAMPLIRYRTGDVASLDPHSCDCGYPGDVLTGLEGRDLGVVSFEGGFTVPVTALAKIVRRFPLRRFQLVRRAPDQIDVLVSVRADVPVATVTEPLAADLDGIIPHAVTVTVRVVDEGEFLPGTSGKDTDYVSLV